MQGLWIGPNTCVTMTEPHTLKWESYLQAPAFMCVRTYADGYTQCTCMAVSSESWCIWPSYLLRGCPRSTNLPLWPNHSLYKSFLSIYYVQGMFFCLVDSGVNNSESGCFFPTSLRPWTLGLPCTIMGHSSIHLLIWKISYSEAYVYLHDCLIK